ncbi:hypothetical protein BDQ17DRAFT_534656 [Cyathus striatus]|nr:hypothetical protein BDQ17DRAFT_534656 [Cyathus striatus]
MLIVHPSSNCDICLDPYSWETPDQTPHAIACGHVFCKTCLGSVSPTNCPFCRGRFDPTRVKKLHVHQCESAAEEEINLLKKLVVEFKSRDDDLVAITTEVDDWLETRDEESFVHLRKLGSRC